jgi:phosphohistidine phosphatase
MDRPSIGGDNVELYLIRHAEAAPEGEGGVTEDADRPLTAKGEEQARRMGKGIERKGLRPDVVVASPLLRARQTADLLVAGLAPPPPEVKMSEELAPDGRRKRLSRYLKELGAEKVALVGHQPDLAQFAAWLIGGKKAHIDIAKAGVAHIVCDGGPGKAKGRLVSLVTPEWLD